MKHVEKVHVIVVHKIKGISYNEAIKNVYKALSDLEVRGIEITDVDQDWFEQHVDDGWNIEFLVEGAYSIIEKLISIEGYRVSDLFVDLQGVTTGSNEFFVFDHNKWIELEKEYEFSKSGLLYDCIAGEDIKPWSITIRRKILFPYKVAIDRKTGKQIWIPAFTTEKGDALDFTRTFAPEERYKEDIHARLNKRIAYGIIPPELAGVAKYLVDNYDKLRSRRYEGKNIEEYAGVWYGFHRPRSPEITKTPSIVTPRVVKQPRFALNMNKVIPLDNVIVLIPKNDELAGLRQELERVLGFNVSVEDLLLYIVSILNSKISHIILKTRATRVRGGYYTIDERYLSSIIIPRPKVNDRDTLMKIFRAIKDRKWSRAEDLIVSLYSKHAKLNRKDIERLLSLSQ